ncbi:DUF3847 domain-containing protein [Eubacteriales bacterium OttesenSCG-928-M02]|nr:DUF3847 domain-containing protein [Eubacteriales bacterium OttesenSCG-928-M02]
MAKSYDERIADAKLKIEQEQNRMKLLIQAQKKEERNARTKRLCSRMGLFESMLPDTIPLTDEQFKIFLEKTVTTEHSRRILDGLTTQNAATATPQAAGTAAQAHTAPAPTTQENGAGREQGESNGTRVSG